MNKNYTLLLLFFCFSCATYYQKHYKFNSFFQQGKLVEADNVLAHDKKAEARKDKLLYYLNRGVVNSMLGNYDQSNQLFENAYKVAESHRRNVLNEAVSFLTNPNFSEYKAEDFEQLLINYYKALNYLKIGKREEALVECKRMNIVLSEISSKYSNPNKFQKDAFIHLLMGLIYDANKDFNNAFIAYRNAVEIYQTDYKKMFGFEVPEQLKKDLLRTAYLTGFFEEVAFYEKAFNMKYKPSENKGGDLVFLWHDGLGPVKSEWSINFNIIRGQGGNVMFVNDELGLSFPFNMNDDEYKSSGLSSVEFIRVAFPKYIERPSAFNGASLNIGDETYHLDKVEDINAIAFKAINDRMLLELGKALLRVALKKAAEYKLRQQNDGAGAALGLFNAITEKSDTRNWQSVPHSIYYTRIPLPEGKHQIKLNAVGKNPSLNKNYDFTLDIQKGQTYFHTFHSLDVSPEFVMPVY